MKQWNRTIKHFGEVAENTKLEFEFEYYGDKIYKSHTTSCGCITSAWNNNKLKFSVNTKQIPSQVFSAGGIHMIFSKNITIIFTDGKTQKLEMQALVFRNEDL